MKILPVVVILVLTTAVSLARIGESLSEVAERYGVSSNGVEKPPNARVEVGSYYWHGFDIFVTYLDGKSAKEEFSRDGGVLQLAEIDAVKAANAPKWNKIEGSEHSWETPDTKLFCLYDRSLRNGTVIVVTRELLAYSEAKSRKNMEGL